MRIELLLKLMMNAFRPSIGAARRPRRKVHEHILGHPFPTDLRDFLPPVVRRLDRMASGQRRLRRPAQRRRARRSSM
ncbi:MAG TPA: hypothetical protein PKL61_10045 [Accumulibacter sp.]|uniref:hypothetical protein n=1 Tax=Accumulibacter sp. TaxID=2053492 RepID=UPI002CD92497|nr:hypothetical protein [Accumulibacter sp.]HNG17073.1 hypothetical protein [Accumulibacter sp.]HNL97493.1 hypothetical protein [Accumulibacter sp.]